MHIFECFEVGGPHVFGGIDIDVDNGAFSGRLSAFESFAESKGIGDTFSISAHSTGKLVEFDFMQIGIDGFFGAKGFHDQGFEGFEGELLVDLDHAPLFVTEDKVDDGELISYSRFDFLHVKAHGTVADDAVHLSLWVGDLRADGLGDTCTEHAHLGGSEDGVGGAGFVEKVRPDGCISAIDDEDSVIIKEVSTDGGDVGGVHGYGVILEHLIEFLSALLVGVLDGLSGLLALWGCGSVEALEFFIEGLQKGLAIGLDGKIDGSDISEDFGIDIDLDHLLFVGSSPIRCFAPPVGFTESRSQNEDGVGLGSGFCDGIDVMHWCDAFGAFVNCSACSPTGGEGCLKEPCSLLDFIESLGMDDAGTDVKEGSFCIEKHTTSSVDLWRCGGQWFKDTVSAWWSEPTGIEIVGRVHDIFGDIDVNNTGSSGKADAQCAPHQFGHAVDGGDCTAPLGHGACDIDLWEVLVGSAAFGVDDRGTTGACDQQNAVSFGLFDRNTGKDIGDTGAIASHAYAQSSGESGVCASHVCGACFMARRYQRDSIFFERGVEAKVRSVDDTKDVLNTFGGQHP